jgi:crotonobetainyl-CoA:carnitine CoA-transferase CaiB-like acyl-CoA transferase
VKTAPLHGVRVVDLSVNLPGPYATHLLAGLGADVTKVEPPKGDPARHVEPFYSLVNAGKTITRMSLPDQIDDLRALVENADVLVEGFRPGVAERLGFGPAEARSWNERLVYCRISAFGQTGPRADQPAHDLNLQALAGVCALQPGGPSGSGLPVADLSASMNAAGSIVAALFQRERTGHGVVLDVAMSDAILSWAHLWGVGIDLAAPVRDKPGLGPLTRFIDRQKLFILPHYGIFDTRDGQIALGIVDENHFWKACCDVVGPRWARSLPMAGRVVLSSVLRRHLKRRIRRYRTNDLLARMEVAGVPATRVNTPVEALSEAQFLSRGLVRDGVVIGPLARGQ